MQRDADVVVVGGGPAGATTAWSLAREGIDVLLLDRARFPRQKPCAEYLSPAASRILDAMGALRAVESAGAAQLSGMRIRAPNGVTFEGRFAAAHGYPGFRDCGLALPRFELDPLLLECARHAGARVHDGWHVTGLVRDGAGRVCGVTGTDATERSMRVTACVVVGADGLRSVVARRLGVAHCARMPRRIAFVAHYRDVGGIGESGEMHVEADGYVGLAHVGFGRTNVALVVPARLARSASGDAEGFLTRWLMGHPHLAERFSAATRLTAVQVTGPFASHARSAAAPGAALVGDAADFFDPFTGEGIYAAMRGGELLGPHVAEAVRAPDARRADHALAAYDRARRREFRGKWLVEKLVGLAVAHPPLLNHAARVLAKRTGMADILVGVAGNFVPPSEVLRARFLFDLMRPAPR